MHASLKHSKNEINFHPDILLRKIPMTSNQWLAFIEEITTLEVAYWKDEYYDNDTCDETQWQLVIVNCNIINKHGSNEYPPYWNKLIKIMKKYIDENIG